jgi:hypothetical protein
VAGIAGFQSEQAGAQSRRYTLCRPKIHQTRPCPRQPARDAGFPGCDAPPARCDGCSTGCDAFPTTCDGLPGGCDDLPGGCDAFPTGCDGLPTGCDGLPTTCDGLTSICAATYARFGVRWHDTAFNDVTCRIVPKRGHVRALQSEIRISPKISIALAADRPIIALRSR